MVGRVSEKERGCCSPPCRRAASPVFPGLWALLPRPHSAFFQPLRVKVPEMLQAEIGKLAHWPVSLILGRGGSRAQRAHCPHPWAALL